MLAPTLAGMEPGTPTDVSVDLARHVRQITRCLEEMSGPVVAVGWSYGGAVMTAAASRCPARLERMVYLDAYVPSDGRSVLDYHDDPWGDRIRQSVAHSAVLPPVSMRTLGVEDPHLQVWLKARLKDQPLRTWTQPVRLSGPLPEVPRAYIRCTRPSLPVFEQFQTMAEGKSGWRVVELEASHACPLTMPDELARVLMEVAEV